MNKIKDYSFGVRQRRAQWVRALAAEPDDLSLVPRTHIVEEENQLQQAPTLCQ